MYYSFVMSQIVTLKDVAISCFAAYSGLRQTLLAKIMPFPLSSVCFMAVGERPLQRIALTAFMYYIHS